MANGASPFPSADSTKFLDGVKITLFDLGAASDSGRKNFAAFSAMSADTWNATIEIANLQSEMVRSTVESFSSHGSEMLAAGSFEEKATKQIDFAKRSYEAAVSYTQELAGLYAKSLNTRLALIEERIAALSVEINGRLSKTKPVDP
jgi:phasin family protein